MAQDDSISTDAPMQQSASDEDMREDMRLGMSLERYPYEHQPCIPYHEQHDDARAPEAWGWGKASLASFRISRCMA